jgi:hypothetical protein
MVETAGMEVEFDDMSALPVAFGAVAAAGAGYTVGAVAAGANPTDYLLLLSTLLACGAGLYALRNDA